MTNLKRIIDEKGVQQRWLAEQVGVTEVSMSRYVNGERIPKAPMAIMMADALGVDVKELYGWDDEHVVGKPEQPETHDKRTETHSCDLIDRQNVRYKLTALVNELEEIFAHIRERNVDDSVCGLCEYDGAYMGQSGDWCNECPGFDRDDCFKLKEKYREEWLKIDG